MIRKQNLILLLVLLTLNASSQQNRIKLGFFGFPAQSGFGIGDIGYERLNKDLLSSWQLHFNVAGGAIATDAGTQTRKWITVEKTFYKKTIAKRISWSYSFFTETGSRVKNPGYRHDIPDKMLKETRLFEISPGASIGIQLRLGKRWTMETQIGPKLIFSKGKEHYYNSIINQTYTNPLNEVKAGFRFTGGFSYQF